MMHIEYTYNAIEHIYATKKLKDLVNKTTVSITTEIHLLKLNYSFWSHLWPLPSVSHTALF